MLTSASKNPSAKGSVCASAWTGNTLSSRPTVWTRFQFSLTLTQRSVAQTWTPNSREKDGADSLSASHVKDPYAPFQVDDLAQRLGEPENVGSHEVLQDPFRVVVG